MYDANYTQHPAPGFNAYIVQKGDTLYKISKRFNVPFRILKDVNPSIRPQKLNIGEIIYIPEPELCLRYCRGAYYMTAKEGTLLGLSQFFNIAIEVLMKMNPGINPQCIMTGQTICIPIGALASYCHEKMTIYSVQLGDTIYSIAKHFDIPVEDLISANPDVNPNVLYVGQNICVPVRLDLYFDEELNISFRHPFLWQKLGLEQNNLIRYEGEEGFFQINVIRRSPDKSVDEKTIEEIYNNYTLTRRDVLGIFPYMEKVVIDSQEACYIFPSSDQPVELSGMTALIIKYPRIIYLSGIPYAYVLIYSEGNYIKNIGESFKFIRQ